MRKSTGLYPSLRVDATGKRVVSHGGSVVLAATSDKVGVGRELSSALASWRKPMAVHDPGKVLLGLAARACRPPSDRARAWRLAGTDARGGNNYFTDEERTR